MPNTVITLKKSATPSAVPASLANGELALNFADGKLYYKSANGSIAAISSGAAAGDNFGIVNANGTLILSDISGDTVTFLPGDFITITGDAINDRVTIGANVKVVYDTANAAYNFANSLSISGASAQAAYDAANQAGVIANAAYGNANSVSISANNYAGAMANAANAYATTINDANLVVARAYTNTSTTAANNYAGAMANAANASASATYATQSSLSTGLTSANNYAGAMANAANASASATYATQSSLSTGLSSANNYAGAMANSGNVYADSLLVTSRAYTNTSTTAANNYAGVMANAANAVATTTFGTITNVIAAFAAANQAGVIANSSFAAANQAGVVANNANTYAGSTYVKKAGDTISGDLVVQGNLTTSGVVTYANTQTLLIGDALITLNNDIPAAAAPSEDAGIEVKRGSAANVALLWNEGSDRWTFTNDGTNYRLIASNTDIESANNYAGAMANAANGYATTINDANLVVARAYTNTSTTAANNYAGAMANSVNASASATYATQSSLSTGLTSANNYAGAMANSANASAAATYATITTVATNATSANNYAGAMANSSNGFTGTVYTAVNSAFGVINAAFGVANGAYTSTNGIAAFAAANQAGVIANSAFGKANNALANTSGVYFNGNLFFPSGNVGIGLTSTTDRLSVAGDVISFGDNYNSGTKALKFQRVENKAAIWSVPVGSFGRADIRFTTGDATVATPKTEADATVRIAPAGGVAIGNAYLAQNPTDGNLLVSGTIGINTINPQTRLHANGSISSYSSDGTNYGVLSSDRISIGQNNAFRTVIAHSGNESLHFIPYGSLTLALSSVDFTPSVQIPSGKTFGWSSTTAQSNSPDLVFHRDAANTFAQRNGTAGQTYRLYGTYTDASNYERLRIAANTTAHYIIGEEGGSGAARPLYLGTNNSTSLTIDASGNVGIGTVSPVAKLSVEGSLRFASDGAGGNWLEFSRSASNQWALNTQGVGTVFSVVGNQITFPQNVIIQRDGLTITPTNTTDTALRVNHSTTTNNSINLNITPTWNGTGNNFTLIGANVTDTASSSLSSLINLKVGGTSKFIVSKDGDVNVIGTANISLPTLIVSGQNVLSTIYTGDAASNAYTNVVGSSANNYAGAMANSVNASASATYATQSSLSTGLTSANNYAGAMANSGNSWTQTIVDANLVTARAYTNTSTTAANTYAQSVGTAGNAYSVTVGAAVNAYTQSVGTAGNTYAATVGTSSNAWASATFGTITNTTAAFAAANQAGVVANNANTYGNSTYVKKSGDTITGDLVVQGNLTTSGVVTYANTQTLLIGDALITLNNDIPIAVAPSEDAGIEVKRGSSANVALLWNEGSDRWTFTNDGTNYRLIASNTDVESANNYAGAMANAANVYATTINDANLVTARAYTNTSTTAANTYATAVGTAGNTYAQTVGTSANNYAGVMANSGNTWASATFGTITNTTAAFAAANQAGVIANAAFAAGNAEYTFSNTIYAAVNSVFAVVNAAYTSSNADYTSTNAAFTVANAAFGVANNAGTATNTTAAFAKANAALANTSGVYFNGNLFFPSGNVGIGLTSTTYKLEVAGSFAAQTKSFVISHPSKEGMFLRHGSLEGPENGVYVRGKVQGKAIELPDYWIGLVDEDTITVQLTAIGHSQNPYVVEVSDNNVFIDTENHTEPYCYFTIYGERKDVEKLVVEY